MTALGSAIDLARAREGIDQDSIDGLERLRAVLAFLGKRLEGTDPHLTAPAVLESITAQLEGAISSTEKAATDPNPGVVATANSHADEILRQIPGLNYPVTSDDVASLMGTVGQYRDRLAVETKARLRQLDKAVEEAATEATLAKAERAKAERAAKEGDGARAMTQSLADEVDALKKRAYEELQETSRLRTEATEAASSARKESSAAGEARTASDSALNQINSIRSQAEGHQRATEANQKATEGLARVASEVEGRITEYQTQLQDLISGARANTEKLVGEINFLLPGATSAGLAEAFDKRRTVLSEQRERLTRVFYGALGLLALLTLLISGVLRPPTWVTEWIVQIDLGPAPTNWQDLMFLLGRKAVLILAPLWIALFANRRLNALFKLEEEYAHKTVMSRSFEGYKRELGSIGQTEGPLAKHTDAVIAVLSRPPGRVLEGKHHADAPLGAAADGVAKVVDSVRGLAGDIAAKAVKP
jgi:hypothetical protein